MTTVGIPAARNVSATDTTPAARATWLAATHSRLFLTLVMPDKRWRGEALKMTAAGCAATIHATAFSSHAQHSVYGRPAAPRDVYSTVAMPGQQRLLVRAVVTHPLVSAAANRAVLNRILVRLAWRYSQMKII